MTVSDEKPPTKSKMKELWSWKDIWNWIKKHPGWMIFFAWWLFAFVILAITSSQSRSSGPGIEQLVIIVVCLCATVAPTVTYLLYRIVKFFWVDIRSPKAEGSVIKYSDVWDSATMTKDEVIYKQLTITAVVMNIGGEGTIYVNVEVTPYSAVQATNPQKIKVLMHKSEEKTYAFDFWADSSKEIHYNAWCTTE